MANLLQKASIVLTPTAYDNGKVLCAKPSEPPYGDFDFSRNSAATRVNAQGLVENVQILSSNLVQNGDFSEEGVEEVSNGSFSQEGVEQISNGSFDTDTKWTTNTGWSISGGSANCDGTQSGNSTLVQQNGIKGAIIDFVVGKTYKVNFDIVVTSGHIANIEVASGYDSNFIATSGNHTTYITAVSTNDRFSITANPSFIGSIDNVSVREVGQDWDLGTGWSIGEDKAVLTNVGYNINCKQANVTTIGQYYKIEFTILDYISGQIRISLGGSATSLVSANGTYVFYLQATINNLLILQPLSGSGTNLSITNISVKEVGQNWSFTSGATLTDIGAKITHTPTAGSIAQLSVLTIGKQYKLTYEITESISGGLKLNSAVNSAMVTTVGVHTKYFEAVGTTAVVARTDASNNDVTITNISVIEITGDTNLPRINYEGFSYDGSGNVVPDSGCGSWLWEPQSTNLITQSELFSGGFWGNYNSTITDNQTTAPDGLLTASKFSGTSDVTAHTLYLNAYPVVSGNDYTYSVFAKKNENNFIQINTGQGFGNLYANFDLDNGVVGSFNTLDANIKPYLNGWFKCSVKANSSTATGQSTFSLIQSLTDVRNPSFNALNNSVYIWGAQLEEQSYATSYIPTSGSTVTRNQDVCTNGGSLASINSTEGVLYAEIAALANDGTNKAISINNGGLSDYLFFRYRTNNQFQIIFRANNNNVVNEVHTLSNNLDFNKIAFSYKLNEFKLFINGLQIGSTITSGAVFGTTINSLDFDEFNGTNNFFGKTKAVAVFPYLSDAELTELTTI